MSSNPPTSSRTDDPAAVYSLEDLASWDFGGTALAVLGYPVAHSVSPQMHHAALNAMAQTQAVFRDWRYFKFAVPPEILPEALRLFEDKGFLGLNLTIPHKVQAVGLVSEIDPAARGMGAVNTLKRLPGGGWSGANSDGYGLEKAVERTLGRSLRGSHIVLLGAGGAARAAAVHCLRQGCASLHIGNRDAGRLGDLLSLIGEPAVRGFALGDAPAELRDLENPLVINATSLGLRAEDASPCDLAAFHPGAAVYDMTYGVDNALARQAAELGLPYADGLAMLVWQGVRSLEIWSGVGVPAQPMMSAACHAKGFPVRMV